MTSEQRFQGYSLERNSSKVMAPPGGKSSISFGSYVEAPNPAPKPAANPAPKAASKPASKPAPTAVAEPAATASAVAPAANPITGFEPNVPAGTRVVQVDRFEKEHQVSNCQKARNSSSVFKSESGNKRQAVKIVNPPGGASSISFG